MTKKAFGTQDQGQELVTCACFSKIRIYQGERLLSVRKPFAFIKKMKCIYSHCRLHRKIWGFPLPDLQTVYNKTIPTRYTPNSRKTQEASPSPWHGNDREQCAQCLCHISLLLAMIKHITNHYISIYNSHSVFSSEDVFLQPMSTNAAYSIMFTQLTPE